MTQIEAIIETAKLYGTQVTGGDGPFEAMVTRHFKDGARAALEWHRLVMIVPKLGFEYLCFHPDYISKHNPNGVLQLLYRSDGAFTDKGGGICVPPMYWQPVPPNPIQLNELK